MECQIYTFGGGLVLWKVFNGLALIFQGGGGLQSVMKLSLAVGGVWAALRAIYGGNVGLFARDYFIPVYLMINLLLVPQTAVHIIDEVDPDFQYSKVDHVPLGIALVASTASRLSKLMTNVLEATLSPVEATQYGKTGPMFAARLVSLARDLHISDPIARQNLKDFVRQCYTVPYLWTNMITGQRAALESTNILQLIAASPHKWLGSYWRALDEPPTFRYCKDGARAAKTLLDLEVPQNIQGLAVNLFGSSTVDATKAGQRLKRYFGDAWQSLAHETVTAHQVAAQEMMMNVYREEADDKRQEFGLARLHPSLIAISSARAKAQQNTGFLVSAQMVGSLLPSLQSTMLALLCLLFVVVLPMAMLPGGLKTLGIWVKLILWVESWPLFYALINCVALMMAGSRGAAFQSQGGGLSLLTQNGLADAAYDAYCYAEGFMSIVPVMAWAVISGGGYALANLSGTVTRSVDGLASRMGAEITDGNLSFDTQNMHNRSIAGYQVAQQQLGSAVGYGHRMDDGRMSVTHDLYGNTVVQENQSQLATNVSGTDNTAASLTETAQHARQAAHTFSEMASDQLSQGTNELMSYAYQHSKGQGVTDSFGKTHTTSQNEDWRQALDVADKISQQTGLSSDKVMRLSTKAGVTSGPLGRLFGLDFGASADTNLGSSEKADLNKIRDSGLQDQLSTSLNKGIQHMMDHKGSISHQDQHQTLKSLQGHFNQANSYQQQAQASLVASDNYSQAASLAQSSSFASTTNWNKQVLTQVAENRFGGNIEQAARWQADHPEAYRQEAARFMATQQQTLIQSLRSDHPLSEAQIKERFEHVYRAPLPRPLESSTVLEPVRQQAHAAAVSLDESFDLLDQTAAIQRGTHKKMTAHDTQLATHRDHLQQDQRAQADQFADRAAIGVVHSTSNQLVKEVIKGGQEIKERLMPPSSSASKSLFSEDSQKLRESDPFPAVDKAPVIRDPLLASSFKTASQERQLRELQDALEDLKYPREEFEATTFLKTIKED